VFPIGSVSKSFATLLLAQLADEGRIDWDAPVRTYLPSFELSDPYITKHLTLRDICSHRTGLPRHDGVWYGANLTGAELVERLKYLEFAAEFRQQHEYNNLLYMAAGYLTEVVAGQPWSEMVEQRIFQPLMMDSSSVSVSDMSQGPNFSYSYNYEGEELGWVALPSYETGGVEAPAGGINSSIVDMAQYALAQLGELPGAASPGQLRQMHTAQITFGGEPSPSGRLIPIGYGLGWMSQVYRGHYCVNHDGSINNFNSQLLLFPRDRAAVIVLVNTNTPLMEIAAWDAVDRVLELPLIPRNAETLQKLREAEAAQLGTAGAATEEQPQPVVAAKEQSGPAHQLSAYAGLYSHPAYGEITVTEADGMLFLSRRGATAPLVYENFEVFFLDVDGEDFKPQFLTDREGVVSALTLQLEPTIKPLIFKRVIPDPADDPAFLAAVVGDYSIDGQVINISAGGESLRMLVPGEPVYQLVPKVGGGFSVSNFSGFGIRFVLDPASGPAKLVLVQPDGEYEAQKVVE
jgi:CubicO group peptidase (beta-lactamase class C family)